MMAAGSVLFWGASFPLTKVALQWLEPTSLALVRWTISTAVLGIYVASRGKAPVLRTLLRREGCSILWIALAGITFFYFLENAALQYTTVVNSGVITNLVTVFVVLLGTIWLGERLGRTEWVATAAAFVGAALVSQGSGHLSLSAAGLKGDLMMVLATFLAALYSIGGKRLVASYPADVVMTAVAFVGTVFLLPPALWEAGVHTGTPLQPAIPVQGWLAVLALGIGSGALANLWWFEILACMDASRAALILLLVPVVSTAGAILFLGEALYPTVLFGAILVLGGVLLVERSQRRGLPSGEMRQPPGPAPAALYPPCQGTRREDEGDA
jgi:drug/metabolite transporter (DMT)-like permease